ncbi:hypothetical protein AOT82_129 [Psychrobacter sp. AntiMn-1]|nr:hypothetical protein AOT82_129 [Psychrobacter sp. AntiMn-1]
MPCAWLIFKTPLNNDLSKRSHIIQSIISVPHPKYLKT